jgi:hypothetical protein
MNLQELIDKLLLQVNKIGNEPTESVQKLDLNNAKVNLLLNIIQKLLVINIKNLGALEISDLITHLKIKRIIWKARIEIKDRDSEILEAKIQIVNPIIEKLKIIKL